MPGRDGTGPFGQGNMTGRGAGNCGALNSPAFGRGMGFGRGNNCRRANFTNNVNSTKQNLVEEKSVLELRLDAINKQLENK